jgi:hypothetical protein
MNGSNRNPIVDARIYVEGKLPTRQRNVDGEIITERVPNQVVPRVVMMLDADGNVCDCVLSTGAASPGRGDYPDYLKMKWASKGWLVWGRCPVAQFQSREVPEFAIPDSMRTEKACDPESVSPRKPCSHMLSIERTRKALSKRRNDDVNHRYKSAESKLLEATQAQSSEVAKAVAAEVAKAIAPYSRGPAK